MYQRPRLFCYALQPQGLYQAKHLTPPDRLSVVFADSLRPTDLSKKLLEAHPVRFWKRHIRSRHRLDHPIQH
jgi:hypothetical protein